MTAKNAIMQNTLVESAGPSTERLPIIQFSPTEYVRFLAAMAYRGPR